MSEPRDEKSIEFEGDDEFPFDQEDHSGVTLGERGSFLWLYTQALEREARPTVLSLIDYGVPLYLSRSLRSALKSIVEAPIGTPELLLAAIANHPAISELGVKIDLLVDTGQLSDDPSQSIASLELLELFALAEAASHLAREGDPVINVRDVTIAFSALPNPRIDLRQHAFRSLLHESIESHFPDFKEFIAEIRYSVPESAEVETPRSSPPHALYPSRASDRAEIPEDDALGLDGDTKALAELICLKDPGPPLAIGLFGDWGAGKSTFMKMIDHHTQAVTALERQAFKDNPEGEQVFVQNVVQVHFNAWHYSDANLWASIAANIFRKLNQVVKGKDKVEGIDPNALKGTLSKIAALNEQIAASQAALDAAREERSRLEGERDAALKALANAQADLDEGLARALSTTARDALRRAGLDSVITTGDQLIALSEDSRALAGRWPLLRAHALAHPIRSAGWLLASMAVLGVGLWAAPMVAGQAPSAGLAVLGAASGVIARAAAAMSDLNGRLGPVLDAAAAAKADAAKRAREALAALIMAQTEAAELKDALTALHEEEARLQRIVDGGDPGAALEDFLATRAGEEGYGALLGIVSRLHEDFETLSTLLEQAETKRETAGKPPHNLQRIVLYIDDLDRCPDKTVVKVLEAVHLLLALPLFAVVVGVDSRWLEGALEREYDNQLGEGGVASASDYLEKIFQLPYWLPRLDTGEGKKTSFSRLVDTLVPELDPETGEDEVERGGDPVPNGSPKQGDEARTDDAPPPEPAGGEIVWVEPERSAVEEREAIREQVSLTIEERACIKALAPLIGKSPRAVKRFMNSYRFLKARGEVEGSADKPGAFDVSAVSAMLHLGMDIAISKEARELVEAAFDVLSPTGKGATYDTVYHDFKDLIFLFQSQPDQVLGVKRLERFRDLHPSLASSLPIPDDGALGVELAKLIALTPRLDNLRNQYMQLSQADDITLFRGVEKAMASKAGMRLSTRLTFRRPY
jgi:ribosomal 50S subunit-associated protein YjgA (DUF615 family)